MTAGVIMFNQNPTPLFSALSVHFDLLKKNTRSNLILIELQDNSNLIFSTSPYWFNYFGGSSRAGSFSRLVKLLEQESKRNPRIYLTTIEKPRCYSSGLLENLLELTSLEELIKVEYMNLPAGRAIANYLVRTKNTRMFSIRANRYLISNLFTSYVNAAKQLEMIFAKNRLSQLNIYQGNFLYDACAIDVAESMGIEVKTFGEAEIGFTQKTDFKFTDYNGWVRDLSLLELDKLGLEEDFLKTPEEFLEQMKNSSRRNFTKSHTPGYIRPKLQAKRLVTYFSGNPNDERFGYSSDWSNELEDQVLVVKYIADVLKELKKELVVRVHPNTLNKPRKEQRIWNSLSKIENVILIKAGDRDDTYELLENSDLVITPGSTIGVEASAAGVCTITTLPAFYDGLEATHQVSDYSSLKKSIERFFIGNLVSIDPKRAASLQFLREIKHFIPNEVVNSYTHISNDQIYLSLDPRRSESIALKFTKLVVYIRTLSFNSLYWFKH